MNAAPALPTWIQWLIVGLMVAAAVLFLVALVAAVVDLIKRMRQ